VPFGPTVEETFDIFPAQDPDAPILVFIHGGYWRANSSKEFSWVARGPVALGRRLDSNGRAGKLRANLGASNRFSWMKTANMIDIAVADDVVCIGG
jgi:hypothetical protein